MWKTKTGPNILNRMIKGFPVSLINLIRCNIDGGELAIERLTADGDYIIQGNIKCMKCGTVFKVQDGILDMLGKEIKDDKLSLYEMQVRDKIAIDAIETFNELDEMEVPSTLQRLGNTANKTILELGCGTGRFTRKLTGNCDAILAVDFSKESLAVNARLMPANQSVGLVRADVSKLRLKQNSFDLALSTLYSNLPTSEIRLASSRCVFDALKPMGRYVLSAHHHEIRERLKGIKPAGEYDNGIFYQSFTKQSLRQELKGCFSKIDFSTICIWLPYISRFEAARVFISKMSERIPLLNNLGALLLATAIKN